MTWILIIPGYKLNPIKVPRCVFKYCSYMKTYIDSKHIDFSWISKTQILGESYSNFLTQSHFNGGWIKKTCELVEKEISIPSKFKSWNVTWFFIFFILRGLRGRERESPPRFYIWTLFSEISFVSQDFLKKSRQSLGLDNFCPVSMSLSLDNH